jgi:hypothetical protein
LATKEKSDVLNGEGMPAAQKMTAIGQVLTIPKNLRGLPSLVLRDGGWGYV